MQGSSFSIFKYFFVLVRMKNIQLTNLLYRMVQVNGFSGQLNPFLFLVSQPVQLSSHVGVARSQSTELTCCQRSFLDLLSLLSNVFKHVYQVGLIKLRRGIFGD